MRYPEYHKLQLWYSEMTKDSVPATAKGPSKFNHSNILTKAWADYRRDEFKGWGVRRGEPFNRQRFAYCLRMAWAVAKAEVARAASDALKSEPVAKVCTNPVRAAEIRSELQDMEFGDFINWTRHGDLSVELSRLHA